MWVDSYAKILVVQLSVCLWSCDGMLVVAVATDTVAVSAKVTTPGSPLTSTGAKIGWSLTAKAGLFPVKIEGECDVCGPPGLPHVTGACGSPVLPDVGEAPESIDAQCLPCV